MNKPRNYITIMSWHSGLNMLREQYGVLTSTVNWTLHNKITQITRRTIWVSVGSNLSHTLDDLDSHDT